MTNNPGKRQPNDFLTLYRQYAQAPMRAIFLYTSEDDETLGTYLRAYHAELDRMSGEQCLIYQPKTLQSYEEDGIDIIKDPIPGVRPPGLTFESMPALLLWDKRDAFVYSFQNCTSRSDLSRRVRMVMDCIRSAKSVREVKRMVQEGKNDEVPTPPPEGGGGQGSPVLLGVLVVFLLVTLGLLIWQLPRVHQYGLGAAAFVVYVFAGLLPAVVTFGMLRSVGRVRGQQFGMGFEFGGSAALFLAVLLIGLHYEDSSGRSTFSVMVILHEQGDRSRIIARDGEIILYLPLKGATTFRVQQGSARIEDIAPESRETTVQYALKVEGYNQMPHAEPLTLTPGSRIYVPVVPAETKTQKQVLEQKLAFAIGGSVAMLGQSTQAIGRQRFEQSLKALGFAPHQVRELSQEYASLEDAVRAKKLTYSASQNAKVDLLINVQNQLGMLRGEQHLAYIGFGYDLCQLILVLRFWETLRSEGNLLSTAEALWMSLQRRVERISIPNELAEKLRTIRAVDMADNEGRMTTMQVLDKALNHFDLNLL